MSNGASWVTFAAFHLASGAHTHSGPRHSGSSEGEWWWCGDFHCCSCPGWSSWCHSCCCWGVWSPPCRGCCGWNSRNRVNRGPWRNWWHSSAALLMNWNPHEVISGKVISRSPIKCWFIAQSFWAWNLPVVVFAVFLFICVTADGDDADCRAGCIRDDDGLPGDVVLVLLVTGGAACLLGIAGHPTAATAALRGLAVGNWAVLEHGAAWGRVLLHPLEALWWQHHLGRWDLIRRGVPYRKKEKRGTCNVSRALIIMSTVSRVCEYLADIWCCLFFLEEWLLLVEGCLMTCATPTFSVWLDGSVTWLANKAGCCMMGL